jgi:hypothetical protein
MDPHYFGKVDLDPDPQSSEKLDTDPHFNQNLGALESQKSMEDRGGSNGAVEDL